MLYRYKFGKYFDKSLAISHETGNVISDLQMLTTGANSTIQPPKGGVGVRKFAAGALFFFFLFAGFFSTAQRAAADAGIPPSAAMEAMAGSAAEVPSGSTAEAPPAAGDGAAQAPVNVAQPPTQDAATTQGATADAAAAQPQQSNEIGATRIDSSGDESASQENDVAVVGAAANAASTSQAASPGPPPPSGDGPTADTGQQATTDQAANAAAAAAQPQQSNVVIIIRINSPGDDVVSQTNVVSVVAVGANQGSTTQNPAAVASAPETSAPATTAPSAAGTSAPVTADPTQSPSSAAPAPLPDAQPAQSSNAGRRLVEHPATVVQQLGPQGRRALSILTSSASSNALPAAPVFQTAAPTTSVTRPQSGGAAGRSGASGPGNVAAPASSGSSVDSDALPVQTASTVAHKSARQSSSAGRVGALPGRIARWLGRTPAEAGSQLGREDSAGGMNLGLLTLTALLVGLLGWAALTWPPLLRR
jgi:hypothetical protein